MQASRIGGGIIAGMIFSFAWVGGTIAQYTTDQPRFVELQRLNALRSKLQIATRDITDAMEQTNGAMFRCLDFIHDQGYSVNVMSAPVADLIVLSMEMRDRADELQVLRHLQNWLRTMSDQMTHSRQMINGMMAQCSSYATVNVKGQALLDVLSELRGPVDSIVRQVKFRVSS
jgi:hypothetical protein